VKSEGKASGDGRECLQRSAGATRRRKRAAPLSERRPDARRVPDVRGYRRRISIRKYILGTSIVGV